MVPICHAAEGADRKGEDNPAILYAIFPFLDQRRDSLGKFGDLLNLICSTSSDGGYSCLRDRGKTDQFSFLSASLL
jgi:hypothetical protein